MTQLELIISNLKSKPEIDAVFVTGSHGIGEGKNYSDIDLGIVINTETDLKSLFQWVDEKPCDVYFFDSAILSLNLSKNSISPNDKDGLIVGFLEKADIKFDKTGNLTSFKKDVENIRKKLTVPQSKMLWFEGIINSAYITNKRYFESNQPEYFDALEVKLLGDLDLLLKGYFEFRNIPWRGERQVLKYLKLNDIKFYDLFLLCIKAPTIKEKFDTYSTLVKMVFTGDYRIWNKETVYPFASQNVGIEGREALIGFWKKLIS